MVQLNMIDAGTVLQIVFLVLSLALTFISIRVGAFGWFITSFSWLGLATQVDNEYLAGVTAGMALFCQAMFILTGFTQKGRR